MASLHPYLNFDGNTEDVFNFYKSVFGGEFSAVMRNKDIPAGIPTQPGADPNAILHIALPLSNGSVLMGGDRPAVHGKGTKGDNFTISIQTESETETRRIFDALSAGGQIVMPLDHAFWGALFGMFNDKYGISWMVNYTTNQ